MYSWDDKTYNWVIAKPVDPKEEVDELDQYVFVHRARIGECDIACNCFSLLIMASAKRTKNPTFFIDVKSESLRNDLRTVLRDVRGISLAEDMPSVC